MQSVADQCLRVIKPGGHALVWAIPRTSHWTGTAWDDAGWQPRDKIYHVFGSGFPKVSTYPKRLTRRRGQRAFGSSASNGRPNTSRSLGLEFPLRLTSQGS
jgi:hypothetical protein